MYNYIHALILKNHFFIFYMNQFTFSSYSSISCYMLNNPMLLYLKNKVYLICIFVSYNLL